MISLANYAKIKDKYCICYYGPCKEYILQLKLLKKIIEKNFPKIQIGFGCRDEYYECFGPEYDVMKSSEIKLKRENYAHISEIKFDGIKHPILQFLENCEIKEYEIESLKKNHRTKKCTIITQATYPAKNLNEDQINKLKKIAHDQQYEIEIDGDINDSDLVMGTESYKLFEAAYLGSDVKLVPTGIGTEFYLKAFPKIKLI